MVMWKALAATNNYPQLNTLGDGYYMFLLLTFGDSMIYMGYADDDLDLLKMRKLRRHP